MTVGGLTVTMGHFAMTFAFFLIAALMPLGGLAVMVCSGLMVERCIAVMGGLTALAADLGHVFAVPAHGLAPLASGLRGFLGVELVGAAPLVSGPASFAGDLPLFLGIHGCEASLLIPRHRTFSFL